MTETLLILNDPTKLQGGLPHPHAPLDNLTHENYLNQSDSQQNQHTAYIN